MDYESMSSEMLLEVIRKYQDDIATLEAAKGVVLTNMTELGEPDETRQMVTGEILLVLRKLGEENAEATAAYERRKTAIVRQMSEESERDDPERDEPNYDADEPW